MKKEENKKEITNEDVEKMLEESAKKIKVGPAGKSDDFSVVWGSIKDKMEQEKIKMAKKDAFLKVTVTMKNKSDVKLERTFFVRKNINMKEFGIAILSSVNAKFTHSFVFVVDKVVYEPDYFEGSKSSKYKNYTLGQIVEINNIFTLEYDMGDTYQFEIVCSIDDSKKFDKSKEKIILSNGQGYGINEDNIDSINAYLLTKPRDIDVESLNEEIKKDINRFKKIKN